MRHSNRIAAAALLLLGAGCASGTEAPVDAAGACAGEDLRAAGLADALEGRGPEAGLARIADCPGLAAPAAREAAEDAYLAGHDAGRAGYCTPGNAEALARRGERPTLTCPPALEPAFAEAYAAARAGRATDVADGPAVRPSVGVGVGVGSGGVSGGLSIGLGVLFP